MASLKSCQFFSQKQSVSIGDIVKCVDSGMLGNSGSKPNAIKMKKDPKPKS